MATYSTSSLYHSIPLAGGTFDIERAKDKESFGGLRGYVFITHPGKSDIGLTNSFRYIRILPVHTVSHTVCSGHLYLLSNVLRTLTSKSIEYTGIPLPSN
jgi:hypothetical protein